MVLRLVYDRGVTLFLLGRPFNNSRAAFIFLRGRIYGGLFLLACHQKSYAGEQAEIFFHTTELDFRGEFVVSLPVSLRTILD